MTARMVLRGVPGNVPEHIVAKMLAEFGAFDVMRNGATTRFAVSDEATAQRAMEQLTGQRKLLGTRVTLRCVRL